MSLVFAVAYARGARLWPLRFREAVGGIGALRSICQEVEVCPLLVQTTSKDWPGSKQRTARWFSGLPKRRARRNEPDLTT